VAQVGEGYRIKADFVMRLSHGLTLTLLTILPLTSLHAADAKWVHATSAHFDLYTSESDSDAKAALQHLEATRAYFLAATHTHDPGGQTVRVVAFHAESDYSKYKPVEVRSGRAYGIASGTAPATVVVQGLKADMFDQVVREYAQLALDDSFPTLPYWYRAGVAAFYSTMKPGEGTMSLGYAPRSSYRNGEVGDVSLPLLFGINREALLASRDKAATDFNASGTNLGATNGAKSSAGSRDPGGSSSAALEGVQSAMAQSQDFARAAWMVVHMLLFQPEYRGPKFGEFMKTLAEGTETGTALEKVYDRPVSKVKADLVLYAKQTGINVATAPFKFERPPVPEVHPATREEQDRIFADLAKRPGEGAK
jgi:hypothetical protein